MKSKSRKAKQDGIMSLKSELVIFWVTLTIRDKRQYYKSIIRGLLPEALKQHTDSQYETDLLLEKWSNHSNDREIQVISNLLQRSILLAEWGWLITLFSLALLLLVGYGIINTVEQVGKLSIKEQNTLNESNKIVSNCASNQNCITLVENVIIRDRSRNFEQGKLTVEFTKNGTPDDRLSIRHQGNNANSIGIEDTNITYEGKVIGSFEGGTGIKPLVVTFNANATLAVINAVIKNVTYHNISNSPNLGNRTVNFTLSDGDGGVTQNPYTKTIYVIPDMNDITITMPNPITIKEDSNLPISGIRINAPENITATVTLKVSQGIITVKPDVLEGLTTDTIRQNATSEVFMTDTIGKINTTLADAQAIIYSSDKKEVQDSLTVSVDFNTIGETSVWSPNIQNLEFIRESMSITVDPINASPVVVVPDTQTVTENKSSSIKGINVSDRDNKNIEVILKVDNGTISVKSDLPQGLPADNINNNKTDEVKLTGDIAKINNIFADPLGVIYRSSQNSFRQDQFSVTATDGSNQVNKSINIIVNDNPVFINYSDRNLNEVRSKFCKDAFGPKRRENTGQLSIQVASFLRREDSEVFKEFMIDKFGSGEVGEPNLIPKKRL